MVSRPYPISAPALPFDTAEAKAHLHVWHDVEDTLIEGLIRAAAAAWIEDTGRVLRVSTWEQAFEHWPCEYFELTRYPVASIASIKYTKSDGTEGTVSSSIYYLSTATRKPRVYLNYAQLWPTDQLRPGPSIRVQFSAGTANDAEIDGDIVAALKLRLGDLYKNREDERLEQGLGALTYERAWRSFVRRHSIEP
jgi:uncharacterized phiE125 gp8 family phage protein